MAEHGRASELIGVQAGLYVPDLASETGHMFVERWDEDQTAWASRKLGGEAPGHPGFIHVNDRDFKALKIKPYSATWSSESNLITTAGWGRVLTLAIGGGGTSYASASCRVGVSTSTAAASANQTDLSGASATASGSREWQMVTAVGTTGGATGSTAAQLTYIASFSTGNANFTWAEWGTDQGLSSGYGAAVGALLNRAVSAQGQKNSGSTWTATCVLSFT